MNWRRLQSDGKAVTLEHSVIELASLDPGNQDYNQRSVCQTTAALGALLWVSVPTCAGMPSLTYLYLLAVSHLCPLV